MVAGAFAKPFAFNVFAYVIVGTNCSKHVFSKAEFVPKNITLIVHTLRMILVKKILYKTSLRTLLAHHNIGLTLFNALYLTVNNNVIFLRLLPFLNE